MKSYIVVTLDQTTILQRFVRASEYVAVEKMFNDYGYGWRRKVVLFEVTEI